MHLVGVRTLRRDAKAVLYGAIVREGGYPGADGVTVAVVQLAEEEDFSACDFVDEAVENVSNQLSPPKLHTEVDKRLTCHRFPLPGSEATEPVECGIAYRHDDHS